MKWNKEAQEVVDAIPMPEIMKNMTILYAEKLARKNKKAEVSMDEVTQTRDDYFELFGDTLMKRLKEVREKGVTDDAIDPVIPLNQGPKLYQFELCHMRFVGCTRQLIDVVALAKKIDKKMKEWNVTEMIADKFDVPFMPHTNFTVSISSCPNNCTAAEVKDIGIHGVAVPAFSHPEKCTKCGKCAEVCIDRAIMMEKDGPVIIEKHCSQCGACAIECPEGAMTIAEKGYRVMVGGHFGRWHHIGKELFKLGDEEKVFKALEASLKLLREKAKSEEHLYHMVERYGLEPIYRELI
jgi:dissimilatory sulfite reductase (desulfoviridin) alpha/beta subunit